MGEPDSCRVACDECHRRKRACSKDLSGCTWCLSNVLQCVYSPKQRMGRPRQKQQVHLRPTDSQTIALDDYTDTSEPPASFPFSAANTLNVQDMEIDFNKNFDINYLVQNQSPAPASSAGGQNLPSTCAASLPVIQLSIAGLNMINEVDFGNPNNGHQAKTSGEELSMPSSYDISAGSTPSFPKEATDETSACNCLRAVFQSYSNLTELPSRPFDLAVSRTRESSRILHDIIHCGSCNMRNAGSLRRQAWAVPLLCAKITAMIKAYAQSIELIEERCADYAESGDALVPFSLSNLGGLWGELDAQSSKCSSYYNDHDTTPSVWRTTIRALLRADVYGFDINRAEGKKPGLYHHPGIVDHLDTLEIRCGEIASEGNNVQEKSGGLQAQQEKTDECLYMVQVARLSLDSLGLT